MLTFALYAVLGGEGYAAWGWRVIFLIGALLAGWMLVHYSRHVVDAQVTRNTPVRKAVLHRLFSGSNGLRFVSAFVLMSGLWFMTDMAVVVLTGALKLQVGLPPQAVTATLFWATAASAPAMLLLGHLSTFSGRRRFFVIFGIVSALTAPALYMAVLAGPNLTRITLLACALQCVTVSGYGPVGAHLAEQFSAGVRSSGYGMGYSFSIVIPALFPYYLPSLQRVFGPAVAPAMLLTLGGLLVALGGVLAKPGLIASGP